MKTTRDGVDSTSDGSYWPPYSNTNGEIVLIATTAHPIKVPFHDAYAFSLFIAMKIIKGIEGIPVLRKIKY